MPAREIDFQDFGQGDWIATLAALLTLPRRPPARPNGAEPIADFVLERI
jgi:hypothetical protein